MANKIQLIIEADDQASTKFKRMVAGLEKGFSDVDRETKKLDRSTSSLGSTMKWAGGIALTYFGGRAVKDIARNWLNVASSFEQMEIQLDTLTKGKGKETLEALNTWAKKMPVNTEEAVRAFIRMQAMGLDPTLDKMTILIDVASVLGDEALPRVSRALGQMASLGKISAEELNQLSEVGINARKILKDAFGMTVEELQKSQISINEIITAIWKGLEDQYKGGSKKAMSTIKGMAITLESYWTDFNKKIAEAEGLGSMESAVASLLETIQRLEQEGTLQAWAEAIGGAMATSIRWAEDAIGFWSEFFGMGTAVELKNLRVEMDDLNKMIAQGGEWTEYGDGVQVAGRSVAELELQLYYLKQRETELVQSLQDHKTGLEDLETPQLNLASALTTTSDAMQLNLEKVGPLAEGLALYKQQLEDLKAVGLGDEGMGEGATSIFPSAWPEPEAEQERADTILDIAQEGYAGLSAQQASFLQTYAADYKKRSKLDGQYHKDKQAIEAISNATSLQNLTTWASAALTIMNAFAGGSIEIQLGLMAAETIIKYWLAMAHAAAGSARALAEHPWPASVGIAAAVFAQGVTAAQGVLVAGAAGMAAAYIRHEKGHEAGGWIRGGSGTRDDVYLGTTSDQTAHLGMGGEFVVNRRQASKYGGLLEDINEDRVGSGGEERPIIIHNYITVEVAGEPLAEFVTETIYERSKAGEPIIHQRGITVT